MIKRIQKLFGRDAMASLSLLNAFSFNKRLAYLLIIILLGSGNVLAQGVSLTFSSGYLGTQASASQQTSNIKNLSSIGISRVSFSQSYSGTFGGIQGNDLSGVIRLYMNSGQVISLNGALNWRETTGNNIDVFGLIFDPGQNATITYGTNQTYNIIGGSTNNTSTSLGLKSYASSVTFTDGASRNGNAATSSIIGDMNTELASSPQPSTISLTNTSVIEGQNLVYTVSLSSATLAGRPQVYTFSTSGTSTKGADYGAIYTFSNGVVNNGDGTITVPGGVSSFTVTISTIDDSLVESIENVLLAVGSKIGLGSIADNDISIVANCDPNSLYDNIVSGYHQSIAKKSDGTFAVWGGLMANDGVEDRLSPTTINSASFPNLVGTPLKVAVAGEASSTRSQAVVLSTDGLYAWGAEGYLIDGGLTSSSTFARISTPTGGDANTKLPTGVTPGSIKMMVAFYKALVLVTNSGNVWVLSTNTAGEIRGVGTSASAATTWSKVKIDASTDLTNVISVRGMIDNDPLYNGLMALTADGKAYVWGKSVYLADGAGSVSKSYATQMVLPAEFNANNLPKMIAVTGGNKTSITTCKNTFYILSNGGNLYAVGDNQKRQIGDFTTTERRSWVRVKLNANTDFTNINFISAMESDPADPAVVAITKAGVLYTWGFNPRNMIGRPTTNISYDPGVPAGFTQGTDKAIFAEMGGHTLVYIKEGSTQFCYVGHRVDGSMGDGTNTDADELAFNCSGTPSLAVCGSVPVAASTTTSTITANPISIGANGITTSTITVQLKQANGTNLTSTGGTVVITTNKGSISDVIDNNDGTYTAILTSSTFVEAATLNFTLNGANGTNNASVNFTAVTNPVLTASGALKTFTSCSGCTVAPQSFSISGVDLATNNLVVTAPTGFQVSTNPTSGFATSINIVPTSGTVTTTTVYAKLTNNAVSVASGVISVTSTGAAAKTLTVTTNTDNALSFDGSKAYGSYNYVSLNSSIASAYNNNSVTVEAWIKTTETKAINEIIAWGSSAATNNVVEFRTSGGKLQFILNNGAGKFYGLESTNFVNTGKWVHVAVVKSGTNIVLYVNGQVASGAASAGSDATSSPSLNNANIGVLGYNTGSSYNLITGSNFSGEIDQVRVWNTVKTGADILSNMFVEMAGNETGLMASYDFNQGVASGTNAITTLIDRSINSYNGTLTNFPTTMSGSVSNFVAGSIPEISAVGNVTILSTGNALQLSNGLAGGVWASSNTALATVNSTTGLVTGLAAGSATITYTICNKTVSYALTLVTPTITTSGTLKTFTSCSGCSITPQVFTLSGTSLGANVTVTAPTGFEISNALAGTYSTTLSFTPTSGTLATTNVFARLINSAITATSGNFTVASTGAASRTVTATVNSDNALMLDGAGDYVNLGDVLDNTNLANTTEAWVYWKGSTEAFSEIFTKDVIQAFTITSSNKLHTNFGNGSSWISGLNSITSIPLNTWTHVAVTRSSTGVVKMYINGVLDASTNTMNVTGNNTALRSIGAKVINGVIYGAFTGAIDNIKFWNVEKSITDITNGMYTELAGNETDLLAYYDFNQGIAKGTNTSITSLLDKGPSAFNGTITGVTLTGSTSNFVDGSIPEITAAGNATTVLVGGTLALSNGLAGGVWSSSNSNIASINTSTGLVSGVSAGNATMNYTICGKVVTYNLSVLAPTLTTGTLKTFTSCSGCVITPQSFTVAGTNLSAIVTVTAPTGFEISNASGGTYSSTLTLTSSVGTLSSTNVFARLINSATTATGGNFTVASTGAATRTVTATVNTDNTLRFDGVNDIVSTAGSLSALNITGDITIETWVKLNQIPTDWLRLVGKGSTNNRTYGLWVAADGTVLWQIFGLTFPSLQTTTILEVGKWYHIAATRSGNTLKIYINNQEVASATSSGVPNTNTEPLELGGTSTMVHASLNGSLDEVRVWNVARTASQILDNYLVGLGGNETGLVAYYNFDQGTINGPNTAITSLVDRTANAINGTLTNFAKTGTSSNFVAGFIPEISGNNILNKGLTTTYTNGLTGGTWTSAATNIATVNATTGVVTGVNPGTSTITYTICEKTVSKVVTVVVPTITKTGTLSPFTTCLGTASDAQTFTVSAQYLTANLVLTAPAGYEIATSLGGTYSSTISIVPTSGSVSARLIYVRLSTASVNGQSGNIAITSTDAVTQNVSTGTALVTRSVTAGVTILSDATNNTICAGSPVVFTATPTNGGNSPIYQWKLNGANITGANSATYSSTSLVNNDAISVLMTSSLSTCINGSPASSNTITTTVTSVPNSPGTISGQSVICMNSNQVYSIAAVPGATSYTWVVDGNLTATTSTSNVINITAANTANGSGTIKVLANNACGSSIYSAVFSVTISTQPAPTASFTLSANNVCLTNGAVTFTSTSTPNATTNSPIGTYSWTFGDGSTAFSVNASNTYTTAGTYDPILTITDGNQCTSSFSSRITVDPASVAGTASVTNPTICEGSSTGLNLTGYTGAIQWQKSTDGINFTNITGANTAAYNTGNLTTTTYYQAVVTSGVCSAATSGVITVTVSPTPAVTLASLASINSTATSFDLTYSNAVGSPDEYSITAVGPNAMPNFVAISNYGLPVSPITVSVPASTSGVYNFNLLVKNGSLGCVSSVVPFNLTIIASSSTITVTGLTTYTFNGSGQGPVTNTKTGSTGAVTYSYSGTGSTTYGPSATLPTDAGTYEVIATLAADVNYSGATSAPYAFTITAASSTITVTGLTTYTFNGSGQGPVTNTKTGSMGAVTYSYSGTGSTTYPASATLPTGVGTYQVIATLASDANYSGATSAPYAFTITVASSTITVTGLTTYTFNGSGQGPVTNTKTGSTGAVTYSYSGTGSTTYGPSATLPTGIGTYQVIATLAADANYSGATSAPYAFTITAASSTITVTGLTTYTYNGSGQGPVTNTKTGSTGAVTYSYSGTGSTTYGPSATLPTGVGTYQVIATLASDANYSGATSAPYAFTITVASSTITVTGLTTYTFNGSGQGPVTNTKTGSTGAVTYSYVGTGSTTYGPSSTLPTGVGTYQVIATLASDANYSGATSAPYAFTITAASSTITVTGLTTYTYNGSAQGPVTNTKTGSMGAVTYSYVGTGSTTYGPSSTLPTGVGTYQVIATLASDANYSGATSAQYAFAITSASSTITVTGLTTYTYNGSAQGPVTNTKTGSMGAVTYSYSGTGSTTYPASATLPTGVGTYQVVATLAADANYSGATSAPYAFTITGTANPDTDGDGVTDAQELLDGTDPNNGCSFVAASKTLTPSTDWNALDCDGDGNPNATDPNKDAPSASNDQVTLPASGIVTINILINDDFLPGINITITRQSSPNQGTAKGTVTFNPLTGEMTYKRAPFESGLVTLGYRVSYKVGGIEVFANAFVTILSCDLEDPLADCDGDGVPNGTDSAPSDPCVYSTTLQVKANVSDDWKALDCDGDGVINGTELTDGTSPADGCSFKAASSTLAPSAAWLLLDCDADGILNKAEGKQDFDGDGIPNCLDTDSDGDGISDKLETVIDTDKDGKSDYMDLDSDNDGILDSVENGVCTGTTTLCDTDADGIPNFRDLDSDGDQIFDVVEANGADFNQDAIADGNTDEKGIPLSANKGLIPPDTDKDGKSDPYDVDSDGDGILDFDEEFNEEADFADCDNDGIINRLDPDECEIFSPQGISPNGDGKNDRLVFKGLVLRKIPNHLSIYNRWGTLVYEMESYDNSFTGTVLPDGTYYYILDFFGKKPTISNYLSVDRTIK